MLPTAGCGDLTCLGGTGDAPVEDSLDDGRLCLGDLFRGLFGEALSQRIGATGMAGKGEGLHGMGAGIGRGRLSGVAYMGPHWGDIRYWGTGEQI